MFHNHIDTFTMFGHGWFGLVFWSLILLLLVVLFTSLFSKKNI